MGMYDNVNYECRCPNCGETVTGFQSKDGPCELGMIEVSEAHNFYTDCHHCDEWIEFVVRPTNYVLVRVNAGPMPGSKRWVEINGPVCRHPRVRFRVTEGPDEEWPKILDCPDCGQKALGHYVVGAEVK